MRSTVGEQVEDYLRHLVVERGLSDNTVQAYRRDLARYQGFLDSRGIRSLPEVTRVDVEEFRRHLDDLGLAPASVTRSVVAVRNLHRFAAGAGQTPTDVTAGISPGTRSRRLPKALSMDQVEALLAAPDTETVEGLRDVALLELLYGTGARVSEICALDVDDIRPVLDDPELGLRLVGKGDKERIVPLGNYAAKAVNAWLVRGRPSWAGAGHGDHALLSVGRHSSRRPSRGSGRRAPVTAQLASLLRHPPARRWSRCPSGAGTPGAFLGDDDTDLHPGDGRPSQGGVPVLSPPSPLRPVSRMG